MVRGWYFSLNVVYFEMFTGSEELSARLVKSRLMAAINNSLHSQKVRGRNQFAYICYFKIWSNEYNSCLTHVTYKHRFLAFSHFSKNKLETRMWIQKKIGHNVYVMLIERQVISTVGKGIDLENAFFFLKSAHPCLS